MDDETAKSAENVAYMVAAAARLSQLLAIPMEALSQFDGPA